MRARITAYYEGAAESLHSEISGGSVAEELQLMGQLKCSEVIRELPRKNEGLWPDEEVYHLDLEYIPVNGDIPNTSEQLLAYVRGFLLGYGSAVARYEMYD